MSVSVRGYEFAHELLIELNAFRVGWPTKDLLKNEVEQELDGDVLETYLDRAKNYMLFKRDIMTPMLQRTAVCFVCSRRFKRRSSRQRLCGDCLIILKCDVCSAAFIGKSITARRRCKDHSRTRV